MNRPEIRPGSESSAPLRCSRPPRANVRRAHRQIASHTQLRKKQRGSRSHAPDGFRSKTPSSPKKYQTPPGRTLVSGHHFPLVSNKTFRYKGGRTGDRSRRGPQRKV